MMWASLRSELRDPTVLSRVLYPNRSTVATLRTFSATHRTDVRSHFFHLVSPVLGDLIMTLETCVFCSQIEMEIFQEGKPRNFFKFIEDAIE